ncbi:hypothetical protein ACFFRR_002816 [Megaselia abdita]
MGRTEFEIVFLVVIVFQGCASQGNTGGIDTTPIDVTATTPIDVTATTPIDETATTPIDEIATTPTIQTDTTQTTIIQTDTTQTAIIPTDTTQTATTQTDTTQTATTQTDTTQTDTTQTAVIPTDTTQTAIIPTDTTQTAIIQTDTTQTAIIPTDTTQTATTQAATTPKPTPPPVNACGGKNGYILDPNSKCKNYYICSGGGSQISSESYPCSFGLFDVSSSQCVLNCPKSCDPKDCKTDKDPDCGGRNYPYIHKKDCRTYTKCEAGKEETITCGSNQYASEDANGNVGCVQITNNFPDCIENQAPVCNTAGAIPDPDDCRAYIQCRWNRFQQRFEANGEHCPNGWYFNQRTKRCASCNTNNNCNYC